MINPNMGKDLNSLTPTDLVEMRNKLVAQHGRKIITGPSDEMTPEEKVASIAYRTYSDALHEAAPNTIAPDQMLELYERQGVDSLFGLVWKYLMKGFWIILALAALLAILKFLLSS
jgi:tetrahydromethanopterin S-methyltransferase subunit B